MKTGRIQTYINPRLGALLGAHGPATEGARQLAEKLAYIVPGWDRVLREEAARWRALLAREEWQVCQQATLSHAFTMDVGGAPDLDLGAVLACVEDSLDGELSLPDAARWRESTAAKLRGASAAAQLSLVWMLLRERRRSQKDPAMGDGGGGSGIPLACLFLEKLQ